MSTFELTANPFWVLRTSIRARKHEIIDAFEEAASDGRVPESELLRAQQAILTPKTRLEAEMTWLPELSPARAEKIVALLSTAPPREIAVALLDGVYGIARVNLAADICNRYPGGIDLVSELAISYRALELEQIKVAIDANRAVSGFGRIGDEVVRELLVKIESVHAKSASACLVKEKSPGRALTSLIDGKTVDVPLEYGFLDSLIREYRAWVEPTLGRIGRSIREEMAALRSVPEDSARVSKIDAGVRLWSDYNAPIEMWDVAKGLEEPRSYAMCKELRELSLFLANDLDRHDASLAITQTLRANFANLPSMVVTLEEDFLTLEGLVKHDQVSTAIDWLKRGIENATANMGALQSSILTNGFNERSTGNCRTVYEPFLHALTISRGTEYADVPWRMVRGLAIDLNNGSFEQASQRLATDLLNMGRMGASPSILTMLEADLRTVHKNITWKQAEYLLKAGQAAQALPLLQSLIAQEPPGDDRDNLNKFYMSVLAGIETTRRNQNSRMMKWVAGAIIVIALIAIKSCSSDDAPSHSSYQAPVPSTATGGGGSATDSQTATTPLDAEPRPAEQLQQPSVGPSAESGTFDDGTESKPPIGNGLALSITQVRYCVFQSARIDRAKALSASNEEIENFNSAVNDFNLRCSRFRYRESDMSAIKAEEASKAVELEQGARNVLQGVEP